MMCMGTSAQMNYVTNKSNYALSW